jgi:hypothetical protein
VNTQAEVFAFPGNLPENIIGFSISLPKLEIRGSYLMGKDIGAHTKYQNRTVENLDGPSNQ